MRKEVRIAGYGGQGVITAAIILAEAAGLHDGLNVTQTQSYGPEARGGASKAEVVISDEPINHPKTRRLDILVALTQKACDLYYHDLKPDGILIVDSDEVETTPTTAAIAAPITRLTVEKLGGKLFTNVTTLGVLVGVTGLVSKKGLAAAVKKRVPAESLSKNLEALELGLAAGISALDQARPAPLEADV